VLAETCWIYEPIYVSSKVYVDFWMFENWMVEF